MALNSPFHRIPLQLFAEILSSYLTVNSVLALRLTCKRIYVLTSDPRIWTRFLQQMEVVAPPFRTTFGNPLEPVDFEAELAVTRAVSLVDNWKTSDPTVSHWRTMATSGHVFEMTIVPGGKILLAAASDSAFYRHFIQVYSLDHGRLKILARFLTPSRAFRLRAKHIAHDGKEGIMILYILRGHDSRSQPAHDSFKTDPGACLYEYACQFLAWDSVGLLVDQHVLESRFFNPETQPPPFLEVFNATVEIQLDDPSFFELEGQPCIAIIQKPHHVKLLDLRTKAMLTMTCHFTPLEEPYVSLEHYHIIAIRVLPDQRQVLVVLTGQGRRIGESDCQEAYVVALYDIPTSEPGHPNVAPSQIRYLAISGIRNVQISDYVPSLNRPGHPPPPLSIFMQTDVLDEHPERALAHYAIWPSMFSIDASGQIAFQYSLDTLKLQNQEVTGANFGICPGVHRALCFSQQPGVASLALGRYVNPEVYEDDGDAFLRRPPHEAIFDSSVQHQGDTPSQPSILWNEYRELNTQSSPAVAWDEGSGRVCVAGTRLGKEEPDITVLDFAFSFDLAKRHSQWLVYMVPFLIAGKPL